MEEQEERMDGNWGWILALEYGFNQVQHGELETGQWKSKAEKAQPNSDAIFKPL